MEPQMYRHDTVTRTESVELYRQYQSLNIQLVEAKHDRLYGIFGYLGFGTLLGIYFVSLMAPLLLPAGLLNTPFALYANMLFPFLILWSLYQYLNHEGQREAGRGAFLPDTSEYGVSLHDLPYDDTLELSAEQYTAFLQTYRNPRFEEGTHSIEQEPLTEPVIVEDRLVTSAAVELYVDQDGQIQHVIHVVHHPDGTSSMITTAAFAELANNVYTTERGDEYLVPITTGRDQSLLWSALGETLQAARHAQELDGKKATEQIPAVREAIRKYEHLLDMLRVQSPEE